MKKPIERMEIARLDLKHCLQRRYSWANRLYVTKERIGVGLYHEGFELFLDDERLDDLIAALQNMRRQRKRESNAELP